MKKTGEKHTRGNEADSEPARSFGPCRTSQHRKHDHLRYIAIREVQIRPRWVPNENVATKAVIGSTISIELDAAGQQANLRLIFFASVVEKFQRRIELNRTNECN